MGQLLFVAQAVQAPRMHRQHLAASTTARSSFGSELWGVHQQHSGKCQRLETARLQQFKHLSDLAQLVAKPITWKELSVHPFIMLEIACGSFLEQSGCESGLSQAPDVRYDQLAVQSGSTARCMACAMRSFLWATICSWQLETCMR